MPEQPSFDGENEDKVRRNEGGDILDHQGELLELAAQYNVAGAKYAHRVAEEQQAVHEEHTGDMASAEAYRTNAKARAAADKEKAALWDSYQHYNQNRDAYHQAAIEEDEKRASGEFDKGRPE